MKRILLLSIMALGAMMAIGQEIHIHKAPFMELNASVPSAETHVYQASSYILLTPGFQAQPEPGSYVSMDLGYILETMEWYYEILNGDGSVTYQYLEYVADTTIHHKDVKIIIKTNTLYDKGRYQEKTREYLYEEDNVVYWWNKSEDEFTVLYDFGAEEGDEWDIHVGTASLTLHVDAVLQYNQNGRMFKMLEVSDKNNLFSGTILSGIGHLTSFFPERLINQGKPYHVEGIRCYWELGNLVFKYGNRDCDEIYEQHHHDVDETHAETGFRVFPNPTDGIIVIETQCIASLRQGQTEYRITNILGQTVMIGHIIDESVDVSALSPGMYFITLGDITQKFVIK